VLLPGPRDGLRRSGLLSLTPAVNPSRVLTVDADARGRRPWRWWRWQSRWRDRHLGFVW